MPSSALASSLEFNVRRHARASRELQIAMKGKVKVDRGGRFVQVRLASCWPTLLVVLSFNGPCDRDPTVEEIADLSGQSESQVHRDLAALRSSGILTAIWRAGRVTQYRLTEDLGWRDRSSCGVSKVTPPGVKSDTPIDQCKIKEELPPNSPIPSLGHVDVGGDTPPTPPTRHPAGGTAPGSEPSLLAPVVVVACQEAHREITGRAYIPSTRRDHQGALLLIAAAIADGALTSDEIVAWCRACYRRFMERPGRPRLARRCIALAARYVRECRPAKPTMTVVRDVSVDRTPSRDEAARAVADLMRQGFKVPAHVRERLGI